MTMTAEFDAFYAATARRVLRVVYAMCGDLSEAQDVTQEAYARAWQQWSRIGRYSDPEAWVRLVAWRLAASRWRSARRWLAVRARLGEPRHAVGPTPDRVAVVAALRRLPEPQRRVVVLHYLVGMSVAEIAADTRSPSGTVKVRLSRARTALALLLDEHERETTDAGRS